MDLYLSTLFREDDPLSRACVTSGWILSAKHGLVHPDKDLEPYDATLKNASPSARRQWRTVMLAAIDERDATGRWRCFPDPRGAEYRDFGLVDGLGTRRCEVEVPTAGMALGEQLRFYKEARGRTAVSGRQADLEHFYGLLAELEQRCRRDAAGSRIATGGWVGPGEAFYFFFEAVRVPRGRRLPARCTDRNPRAVFDEEHAVGAPLAA
jgi:hypothetical protein